VVPLHARARTGALLLLALAAPGCGFFAPSVSVKQAGAARVYESLNENELNAGDPSTATLEVLHTYSLADLYDDEPRAALRALHEVTLSDPQRNNLFALSELAFHVGRHDEDRDAFLASAIYAWLYLFDATVPIPASPYDRRFRWACDLYNAGVQRAFATPDGEGVTVGEEERELPVGSAHVAVDRSAFPWTAQEYPRFVPGDLFLIEGLSLRLRDSGLGVPLIGIPGVAGLNQTPASALLRVQGSLQDMAAGMPTTLELYSSFDARSVTVGDTKVPLESDFSVTLAHALHESPIWKFSLSGLFAGDRAVKENKLRMLRPYQPGRIPVVFVHGTASNPAYWAEMFNTLLGDPELRAHMQFWFFQYASGNPILYSAYTLRQQLTETLASVDPDDKDPAMHRMVLVGHSQGGLIVKLMVVDGSIDWLAEATGKKAEDFGFDDKQMALIRSVYEFKAAPYVSNAVFVCTPQRGSFRADSWYSRMIAKFISIPGEVQGLGDRLFSQSTQLPPELAGRLPTSLDNMNPSNPLVKILQRTPIEPGVVCHSIIAIGSADRDDAAALAAADDGVVQYSAAHMDGYASELLVGATHSCQDNPQVIQEVRRILHEALAGN
jgi:hypothetical protein